MDKDWKGLGSNCTDLDCKRIPNADCYAGLCKCKAGYGADQFKRSCKKSKKIGQTCNPITDTCFMDKLRCDDANHICVCSPGYRYDSGKNDCIWFYYCDDNLLWDNIRQTCVKPNDFWFPTGTNSHPKLSFITFILLVFCFIKVMRSNAQNSAYNERRRRISANLNRNMNSLDLLSTIINYENNQHYQMRNDRQNLRNNSIHNDGEEYYDIAPPKYEDVCTNNLNKPDIMRDDLKQVTIDRQLNNNINDNYLNNQQLNDNLELKEQEQQNNQLNNQYSSTNHLEIQSTSQETISIDNETINQQTINQSDINSNHQLISQSNEANHSQSNDQDYRLPPDYEQAILLSQKQRPPI